MFSLLYHIQLRSVAHPASFVIVKWPYSEDHFQFCLDVACAFKYTHFLNLVVLLMENCQRKLLLQNCTHLVDNSVCNVQRPFS